MLLCLSWQFSYLLEEQEAEGTLSTAEAEYRAMSTTSRDVFLSRLRPLLTVTIGVPFLLLTIRFSISGRNTLRLIFASFAITILPTHSYIASAEQIADFFMKAHTLSRFQFLLDKLSVHNPPLNDTVFGETSTALSFKEIRRRDPSFSLPDFVSEVQEMIRPVLTAYLKGDVEMLKKYCSPEVLERCKAEKMAYESSGIFFDNKILHISDVVVRETKMMGSSPIIIIGFQTQQIYCVHDREGSVTAGGKDSIQTVYYLWAMQQIDIDELGEGAFYPVWRLREMQQIGVQALI